MYACVCVERMEGSQVSMLPVLGPKVRQIRGFHQEGPYYIKIIIIIIINPAQSLLGK